MLRFILIFCILLTTQFISAQNLISGQVYDKKGNPIPGANIYIENTYDGASSDIDGFFSFRSKTMGNQTLVVSCIGFITTKLSKKVDDMQNLQIQLKESVNTLNAVVITAGTFSAGDNSKISALKTLDVLTTAGAAGSYIAAFNALPGTSTVGESGELFIRGGNSSESQTFIDGLKVSKPYSASANNTPSWGRYSPTLFKGMTFSTGGYSAEYG
ncbi:carboxypeptidase-like regulatory domain-containing protein, partial [Ancylomarina sp. 16SWW S1-10-2]|uniref:carboxypeptidase-like regulatory domain-containing protein n=1 Tax=Ancylomarina sp. 16SWW S1-10-2 TaxID=2499681 RepID=UPI0012AD763D